MNIKLTRISKPIRTLLKEIGEQAQKDGVKSYLVGGAVRDLLLKEETLDYDVVVEGKGIPFAEKLARRYAANIVTYQQFGTSTLTFENGLKLDIITARREIYSKPGALPKVKASDMYDDLYRRDFSLNAMAVSLMPDTFGELLDLFNGYDDLQARMLSVLHNQSFIDDPTRILRLIRYKVRFNCGIEKATLGLVAEALEAKVFDSITLQRFFNEFKRMLSEDDVVANLKQLQEWGLDQYLPFELVISQKVIRRFSVPAVQGEELWMDRLAVLLAPLEPDRMLEILTFVNIPRKQRQIIADKV